MLHRLYKSEKQSNGKIRQLKKEFLNRAEEDYEGEMREMAMMKIGAWWGGLGLGGGGVERMCK